MTRQCGTSPTEDMLSEYSRAFLSKAAGRAEIGQKQIQSPGVSGEGNGTQESGKIVFWPAHSSENE